MMNPQTTEPDRPLRQRGSRALGPSPLCRQLRTLGWVLVAAVASACSSGGDGDTAAGDGAIPSPTDTGVTAPAVSPGGTSPNATAPSINPTGTAVGTASTPPVGTMATATDPSSTDPSVVPPTAGTTGVVPPPVTTDSGSGVLPPAAPPPVDPAVPPGGEPPVVPPEASSGDVPPPAPTPCSDAFPATPSAVPANETGADLWLRYPKVVVAPCLAEYQAAFTQIVEAGAGASLQAAQAELVRGLSGLTGVQVPVNAQAQGDGAVVIGTPTSSTVIGGLGLGTRLAALGPEGYLVEATEVNGQKITVVAANTDIGVLYGSFALLRHLQSYKSVVGLSFSDAPKVEHRLLNHWDNLDRTVERGYAGRSLWDWSALPGTLSPRYEAYARANASIGINGTVLTNVNADAQVLTATYIAKVKALADVFRPYGIRVYLTARFSAPIEIGGQSTADPASAAVKQWWVDKVNEIYNAIPDFGGFLVKANSEGQPGPQQYGASHADGANLLADALAPHGGIVMWRAFVYSEDTPTDRIRQAYDEFKPLDGKFHDNVLVQAKNGALDFQPREPFHPLFGAMPQTPLALELQVTKEYLGEDTHLAYLGPLYEEVLQSDTFAMGAGSTVARVVDGSLHGYSTTAMAGVANIGSDTNWTGSHFNQANWYVFGRMAWDPEVTAEAVAEEWVRQTLSNDPAVVTPVTEMMMGSRQALVDYMTPLGLVHIMASGHHYGPGPWVSNLDRPEWNPVYYHKADAQGVGFDRTSSGSNAVQQYFDPVRQEFSSRDSVPDDFLLFFHHVGWQETLSSGRTLWEELVYRYSRGVDAVGGMRDAWKTVEGRVDAQRFKDVSDFLQIQHYEARWWRDACLQYFRTFANLQIPSGYAAPANALSFYQGLTCPSDETKPRCNNVYTGEPSPAILP